MADRRGKAERLAPPGRREPTAPCAPRSRAWNLGALFRRAEVAPSCRQWTFVEGVVPGGWFQDNGVVPHRIVAHGSIRASGLGACRQRETRARLGVVNDRRSRKAMGVGRGARQRRGSVARGRVSGVNLERPSCSEVHRKLVAVGKRIRRASLEEVRSSRWPPRRRTIIPRRPESLSIHLDAPIAFIASRSVAVTSHRDRATATCGRSWVVLLEGVVPAAGDSSEDLSIHVEDL
jgi:hypothetical protein